MERKEEQVDMWEMWRGMMIKKEEEEEVKEKKKFKQEGMDAGNQLRILEE
jgi:hypothetical protein